MSKTVNAPGDEACGTGNDREIDMFFHLCRNRFDGHRLITIRQDRRDFIDSQDPGVSPHVKAEEINRE